MARTHGSMNGEEIDAAYRAAVAAGDVGEMRLIEAEHDRREEFLDVIKEDGHDVAEAWIKLHPPRS
jgi:hypothetical protein